jgi:hypothetical protein
VKAVKPRQWAVARLIGPAAFDKNARIPPMRLAPALAFIAAGFLAACSESNSFTTGNPFTVFADPGEFEFYSCEQLLPQRNALVTRAHDLKLLMDKAEQSTGGAIVNVIAYEADYVTAREQVKVIEETARIKKCNFPDNPQSNAAIR